MVAVETPKKQVRHLWGRRRPEEAFPFKVLLVGLCLPDPSDTLLKPDLQTPRSEQTNDHVPLHRLPRRGDPRHTSSSATPPMIGE